MKYLKSGFDRCVGSPEPSAQYSDAKESYIHELGEAKWREPSEQKLSSLWCVGKPQKGVNK